MRTHYVRITCEVCHKPLNYRRWRFCSNKCSQLFYSGNLNTICACGKPTRPGEQLCKVCKREAA